MRLTVFILLVMFSCCLGHRGRSHVRNRNSSKYYKPIRPTVFPFPFTSTMKPSTTTTRRPRPISPISPRDDIWAELIGVRIPPKECVISFDEFVMHVVDMDYVSPYAIDNDYPVNPEISFKWSPRWTLENNNGVRRRGSYWNDITEKCAFLDFVFQRVDETKAIFGSEGATDVFVTAERKDYMVSLDPKKYVIQYICYSQVERNRCKDAELLVVIKEQRPNPPDNNGKVTGEICMDDIDWPLIEYTFRNCLGQQFVDHTEPQIMWLWENDGKPTEDCAKPGTDAFRRNFENQK
ncbi:uncharacterized protein LOC128556053 [Mercenaria mercenaria]|uniref:uncharacterized protein LOC128556053 n=1 Tax=Mercenaria mercenaria TaxID=6596 RepID=UPI00234E3EF8|nr:uncharacterized protein LOC128556053 [Mercenaria mercenaria]